MTAPVAWTSETGVRVGIDVGGTFTDVVCVDGSGRMRLTKIPTTKADQSVAIRQAIDHMANAWDIDLQRIQCFAHGTTAGTNAVLERKGARIGLITTKGFRDVLEIGRQMRHRLYDRVLKPETPGFLAPGELRHEVSERVAADGAIIAPLDEAEALSVIDVLAGQGVDAIAVCLLFSFLNPTHERRIQQLVRERHPGIMVSLSSEVDPAFREYERTVVTAFDAYVKPVLDRYLGNLEGHLASAGIPAPLQVMQSRGGLAASTTARQRPVRLFLSGPAAGVIGARMVGEEVGREHLITVDIGGTSCDIAVISAGKPLVRSEGLMDGLPVRVPMVDVNAIGAGGGSIARLDTGGSLRVGPASAGSEPGPACYGRGGREPTVTDASVVLGYIDPQRFAGGTMKLDPALARRAIEERIAKPMGISVEAAALGIHRVINAQMVEGVRLTSIRRGFDPRQFSLMPLGGGGAVHATALATELGMREIVVPRHPGVLCAYGLLAAPVEHEMATAFPRELTEDCMADVKGVLAELDMQLAALMKSENVPAERVEVHYSADVCYVGQSYFLEVPFVPETDGAAALYERFIAAHERVYGHATPAPAKIVNLRSVHQAKPRADAVKPMITKSAAGRRFGTREIRVAGFADAVQARILDRDSLVDGEMVEGPAVIEQSDTTLLVEPGWAATLGAHGHLILSSTR